MAAMPAPAGKEEGLPADFLELARATWIEPEHGFGLGGLPEGRTGEAATGTREGPGFWLMRWAWRLEPSEEDVPFLLETTRSPSAMLQVREWAARRIAVLDGRAAGHAYREVLAAGGRVARMAAAEAAVHGRPGAWKDVGEAGSDACWIVDSRAAREAAWQALHRGDVPKSLDEEERWFLACDEHVPVPDEDLRWIAARLGTEGAPLEAEAWFYARAFPEALTKPVAEALAARWAGQAEGLEGFDDEVERALAPMAALAPDATLACLRRWARAAKDEDVRDRALALLARLGDTALVGDMLHVWPFPGGRDALCLGRVKDPRVEAFLRAAVEASDAEEADAEERSAEALATLAVYLGCPEPLASYVGPYARDGVDPGTYARARALVLDEDPIGAVLVCAGQAPYLGGGLDAFSGFGLTDDPRVREQITAWREDRGYGLYWETTAVLALLGDEAAREEWAAFLAEARTFMLDGLQDGRLFTMDGDPEWTARWLSRIDANCCYGWHAQAVIKATYPTFPFRHYAGAGFRARLGGERWFAEHRGTFVRSALLDGWIPVSR